MLSQYATKPALQMFYRSNEADMYWLLYWFVYKSTVIISNVRLKWQINLCFSYYSKNKLVDIIIPFHIAGVYTKVDLLFTKKDAQKQCCN